MIFVVLPDSLLLQRSELDVLILVGLKMYREVPIVVCKWHLHTTAADTHHCIHPRVNKGGGRYRGGRGGTHVISGVQLTLALGQKSSTVRQGPCCKACAASLTLAVPHKRDSKAANQDVTHIGAVFLITDRPILTAIDGYLFFIACKGAVSIALVGLLGDLLGSVPSLLLAQLLNQILHTCSESEV